MKIFSVCGISKSGKTTTIELLIKELIRRGYTVGSFKDIHFEQFAIDNEGTNTYRHKQAGARPVTARGISETEGKKLLLLPFVILKYINVGVCGGKATVPAILQLGRVLMSLVDE